MYGRCSYFVQSGKKPGICPCATGDVHGVEQIGDHRQHVGAGGDGRRGILQRDATDGRHRQGEAAVRLAE